jgi:hypothetical protein
MSAMLHFATFVIATLFAAVSATALNWLFLRAAFVAMQPATARRIAARARSVRGSAQPARAFASNG